MTAKASPILQPQPLEPEVTLPMAEKMTQLSRYALLTEVAAGGIRSRRLCGRVLLMREDVEAFAARRRARAQRSQ